MDKKVIIDLKLKENNRGIYGIFINQLSPNENYEECAYIGKSEQLFERAKQHTKSILNQTSIQSLNNSVDNNEVEIEIRLIEAVIYEFHNYAKDAQRLSSRENYWIDEYQKNNQCLEQVPAGRRPSIEQWHKLKSGEKLN